MTTHFNHSVIGRHVLHDCQAKYEPASTSPPQDNDTRGGWKGAFHLARWYMENQVLPVIGGLIRKLEPGHTLKYGGASVYILNTDVQDARKRFANDLIKRFFNDLMVCKLEDWCVSTLLDPRYKMLQFKNIERWERGTLTKSPVITCVG
ncbi:hypothetical protein CYMTET_12905 [Cymbomonas tetramitiformis]|uniref:Uncharacterized protein n=1 Tax=Cymbomonas tetramitiformis TaxID=36881 RepID=A0AAE0LBK7_9CHLO|nr:hypothetical protein CYMTET_12905 [Cymbomonas tetramitiformis]